MGNFSRNTYVPQKQYVAVRLEQGVPLVDADWNEGQDLTRNELYDGLRAFAPNSALRGGLEVTPAGPGDLALSPGTAVIDGWPIHLHAPLGYSTQRYATAATAAADGVAAVTPVPLTQPGGPRTDIAYLDVFEREVTSLEDPSLVNGAVGIETATRLRREIVLRVVQGGAPPAPAPGHAHLPIAQLNRTAGALTVAQIVDIKPYPLSGGIRETAFSPMFLPTTVGGTLQAAWSFDGGPNPPRLSARKPAGQADARGLCGLSLADRSRLIQIRIRGSIAAGCMARLRLARVALDGSASTAVFAEDNLTDPTFNRVWSLAGEPPVDGSTTTYVLYGFAAGAGLVEVHGISVRYDP
jgi:hypothetical protein